MKVEVVEYYPYARKGLEGTMHVYLPDFKMDVRGLRINKRAGQWSVNFPMLIQLDLETNLNVTFPVISFTDTDTHMDFIKSVRKAAKDYLKEMKLEEKKMYGKAKFDKKKETPPKVEMRHIMPDKPKARTESKFKKATK